MTKLKGNWFLSIAAILALFAFIMPLKADACGAQGSGVKLGSTDASCAAKGSYSKAENSDKMEKASKMEKAENNAQLASFTVKGMTCGGCENQVKTALTNQKGVMEVVKVSCQSNEAIVKYDPSMVEAATIASTIKDVGYETEIIPAVATEAVESVKDTKIKDL
jgi:copper chaperone CopZ